MALCIISPKYHFSIFFLPNTHKDISLSIKLDKSNLLFVIFYALYMLLWWLQLATYMIFYKADLLVRILHVTRALQCLEYQTIFNQFLHQSWLYHSWNIALVLN